MRDSLPLWNSRASMQRGIALFLLFYALVASAADGGAALGSVSAPAVHVATALDHLTVLEFGEPLTMVAAGSTAFQIERHEDKVLIKPLESGASTDLLVWTASRRLIYELDPPGEVKAMNFALDNRPSIQKPQESRTRPEDVEDALLSRALLAARAVDSGAIRPRKETITVRIEHVLTSKGSVYLHYSIFNLGKRSYPIETPVVVKLVQAHPSVSLLSRRLTQLTSSELGSIGRVREQALSARTIQVSGAEVAPGQLAEGVLALAQPLEAGTLLELTFASDGGRPVSALVVL